MLQFATLLNYSLEKKYIEFSISGSDFSLFQSFFSVIKFSFTELSLLTKHVPTLPGTACVTIWKCTLLWCLSSVKKKQILLTTWYNYSPNTENFSMNINFLTAQTNVHKIFSGKVQKYQASVFIWQCVISLLREKLADILKFSTFCPLYYYSWTQRVIPPRVHSANGTRKQPDNLLGRWERTTGLQWYGVRKHSGTCFMWSGR